MMTRLITCLFITLCFMSGGVVFAGWATNPVVVLSGGWGNNPGQFGFEYGDTGDSFPMVVAVLADGKIVILDTVKNKQLVFNANGTLFKEIKWVLQSSSGAMVKYSIPEYSLGEIAAVTKEGNLLSELGGKYYLMSPNGQILTTYTDKPLSFGIKKSENRQPDGSYITVIQYDDIAYAVNAPTKLDYYFRDQFNYVYAVVRVGAADNMNARVYKYNKCGKILGYLDLPTDQLIKTPDTVRPQSDPDIAIIAQYGSPVIAANGDVYTWKRTPNKYSILKWTWVDEQKESKKNCSENLSIENKVLQK